MQHGLVIVYQRLPSLVAETEIESDEFFIECELIVIGVGAAPCASADRCCQEDTDRAPESFSPDSCPLLVAPKRLADCCS